MDVDQIGDEKPMSFEDYEEQFGQVIRNEVGMFKLAVSLLDNIASEKQAPVISRFIV